MFSTLYKNIIYILDTFELSSSNPFSLDVVRILLFDTELTIHGTFAVLQANKGGDYFPVWGTCQGFQMLMTATAGFVPLSRCPLYDKAVPLNFTKGESLMFLLKFH